MILSATVVTIFSSSLIIPSGTKADLGDPHIGQKYDFGKSLNFLPSFSSSYTQLHTVHLNLEIIIASKLFNLINVKYSYFPLCFFSEPFVQ